jgi:hypothetical protein
MPDINLNPYTIEQAAMDRRRKMAESMQQQSILPIEMPNVPGAKVSHLQGLAKILQSYVANKNLEKADAEQKAFGEKYQTEKTGQFQDLARLLSAPAQAPQPAVEPNTFNEGQSTITGGGQAAVPARPAGYLPAEALSQFTHPEISQLAMSQVLSQLAPKAPIKASAGDVFLNPTTYEPIKTIPKEPKWEHTSKFENGKEITGWVNTNAPDIPSSFVRGTEKPEMTESQRLDAELKQFAAQVEADKAKDVGRKPTVFERLPKGVPVGAKKAGKTPDGKDVYELNGKKYVGD